MKYYAEIKSEATEGKAISMELNSGLDLVKVLEACQTILLLGKDKPSLFIKKLEERK